ncbi:hypothetical protein [Anoxybacteroides tepidamans]|uniref:hypothetical protein n=1 Tax=Anoxybacteroides tepidamans TaxID=265948 RepID=UPI0004855435|nr:hypothetical protein [Anoxybacillus tepidamans]
MVNKKEKEEKKVIPLIEKQLSPFKSKNNYEHPSNLNRFEKAWEELTPDSIKLLSDLVEKEYEEE